MNFTAYLSGLSIGLSLIVVIGAQNIFVLRQGLRREHVFAVAFVCALSDAALITLGVTGFGKLAWRGAWLDPLLRYGGAAFLAGYGAKSLWSALRSNSALSAEAPGAKASLGSAVLACLAFTWLNPHVYLDTVVLLGAISTQFPGAEGAFAAGAATGSFLFFFSLAYGARKLKPIFASPGVWRLFEALVAMAMWSMAWRLAAGA